MAAVQHCMRRARQEGIEWLLHCDIDELWYSPMRESCQRDARPFFAALPPSILQVNFHLTADSF